MNPTSDQVVSGSTDVPAPRLRALWLILGFLMLAGVLAICLVPLNLPPAAALYNDKVMHVLTFVLLTVWFGALQKQPGRGGQLKLVGALFFYAIAIEVLQSFTTYRSAEFADLVADLIGILLGGVLLRLGMSGWPGFIEKRILRLPIS
jgi:VanZ family protein